MPVKHNRYIDCGNYFKIELYAPYSRTVVAYALISPQDVAKAQKIFWRVSDRGYARGYSKELDKEVFLHKVVTNTQPDILIDHINRMKLDCRRENLRIASKSANAFNSKVPVNSATGYKGVSFDKKKKKYRAYIKVGQRQIWLGYHGSIADAYKARQQYVNANHIGAP